MKTKTIVGIGMAITTLAMLMGVAGATTGQSQYGNGFPISACGYIHGAFANTNGNFGIIGTSGYAASGGESSTGANNAGASAYCVAQMGH